MQTAEVVPVRYGPQRGDWNANSGGIFRRRSNVDEEFDDSLPKGKTSRKKSKRFWGGNSKSLLNTG